MNKELKGKLRGARFWIETDASTTTSVVNQDSIHDLGTNSIAAERQ